MAFAFSQYPRQMTINTALETLTKLNRVRDQHGYTLSAPLTVLFGNAARYETNRMAKHKAQGTRHKAQGNLTCPPAHTAS